MEKERFLLQPCLRLHLLLYYPHLVPASSASALQQSRASWLQAVSTKLSARSPEVVERARQKVEQQTRARRAYHQSSKVVYSNAMSSHAYAGGLRSVAAVKSAPVPSAASAASSAAGQPAASRSSRYSAVASKAKKQMKSMRSEMRREVEENADDEYVAETAALEVADELGYGDVLAQQRVVQELRRQGPVFSPSIAAANARPAAHAMTTVDAMAAEVAPVTAGEMDALLTDLRVEPTDDAELGAKFEIYEAGCETVQTARESLFNFWAECGGEFDGHAQAKGQVERDIATIDQHENLGIVDVRGQWFVYGMSRKVAQNTGRLDQVLRGIRTKLELLASQDECPICLDAFGETEVATLGCAHMVCGECWRHWSASCTDMRRTPFCPLCKQDAFVNAIVEMTGE